MCVYLYNHACGHIPQILNAHLTEKLNYCQSATLAIVVETAQVHGHTAHYFLFVTAATDQPSMAGCLPTIQTYTRRVEIASAHHFSVKLSIFMCMLAACSGSPPQCSTFSSIYCTVQVGCQQLQLVVYQVNQWLHWLKVCRSILWFLQRTLINHRYTVSFPFDNLPASAVQQKPSCWQSL